MRRADLHLHTLHSDGTFTPAEVVERAKTLGLATISITDHDSVEGVKEATQQAGLPARIVHSGQAGELEVIPGVELTAVFQGASPFQPREIHILGYGLQVDHPEFCAFLNRMQIYRRDRIRAMIDRLREHGVEISFEEVLRVGGEGSLGRPHLAQAMLHRGIVRSFEEAFARYLGDDAPCFVKGATVTVPDAVQRIRSAGGVAVLAHPYRLVQDSQIQDLVAAGIQGIEAHHPDHSAPVAKRYRAMAEEHHLLTTGGSDCHGFRNSRGPLIGSVTIGPEDLGRLKAAIRR